MVSARPAAPHGRGGASLRRMRALQPADALAAGRLDVLDADLHVLQAGLGQMRGRRAASSSTPEVIRLV